MNVCWCGQKSRDSDDFASDGSGKAAARNPPTPQAAPATAERKAAAHDNSSDDGSDYDAKHLSLSDSLGMESADFEVCGKYIGQWQLFTSLTFLGVLSVLTGRTPLEEKT